MSPDWTNIGNMSRREPPMEADRHGLTCECRACCGLPFKSPQGVYHHGEARSARVVGPFGEVGLQMGGRDAQALAVALGLPLYRK